MFSGNRSFQTQQSWCAYELKVNLAVCIRTTGAWQTPSMEKGLGHIVPWIFQRAFFWKVRRKPHIACGKQYSAWLPQVWTEFSKQPKGDWTRDMETFGTSLMGWSCWWSYSSNSCATENLSYSSRDQDKAVQGVDGRR